MTDNNASNAKGTAFDRRIKFKKTTLHVGFCDMNVYMCDDFPMLRFFSADRGVDISAETHQGHVDGYLLHPSYLAMARRGLTKTAVLFSRKSSTVKVDAYATKNGVPYVALTFMDGSNVEHEHKFDARVDYEEPIYTHGEYAKTEYDLLVQALADISNTLGVADWAEYA